jgi:hypothetical protein
MEDSGYMVYVLSPSPAAKVKTSYVINNKFRQPCHVSSRWLRKVKITVQTQDNLYNNCDRQSATEANISPITSVAPPVIIPLLRPIDIS